MSTSDPRESALVEVVARRFGSAGEADRALALELLAALDAVPAPDREKVKAAIEKALPGQMLTHRMLNRAADAAIAAGAGTPPPLPDGLRDTIALMFAEARGDSITRHSDFEQAGAAIAAMRGGNE